MLSAFFSGAHTNFYQSGLNVVAPVMIFLLVPETKQRTLEELDLIFAVLTRTHIRCQITKALQYFFQRWVLFRESARLEPLYHFDNASEVDSSD